MLRVMTALALAAVLGVGALMATANAYTSCTTTCYGNMCTTNCY
jgi:hypothetical protein